VTVSARLASKTTEKNRAEKRAELLVAIQSAIVAHWLRHAKGPSASEIAKRLDVSAALVSEALRRTTPKWILDESEVPGCETKPGGSYGKAGRYPTTWEPTKQHLRSLLRQEGERESRWEVHVEAMPMRHGASHVSYAFSIVAPTEASARAEGLRLAAARVGGGKPLHSNSTARAEWCGLQWKV